MKANELRIGNFVSDRLGIVIIGTNGRIEFADIYKPIPLTEEWLVKFGFVKTYYDFEKGYIKFDKNISDYGCEGIKSNFWLVPNGDDDWYRIPLNLLYVHQLQNLYFALTGEELEPAR